MMEVKATAATPMAMTTSVRLNAVERRKWREGIREEGVKEYGILSFRSKLMVNGVESDVAVQGWLLYLMGRG
jgi:hypothetical protein